MGVLRYLRDWRETAAGVLKGGRLEADEVDAGSVSVGSASITESSEVEDGTPHLSNVDSAGDSCIRRKLTTIPANGTVQAFSEAKPPSGMIIALNDRYDILATFWWTKNAESVNIMNNPDGSWTDSSSGAGLRLYWDGSALVLGTSYGIDSETHLTLIK